MEQGYKATGDVTINGVNQYLYDADGIRVAKGSISAWSCDPTANGFTTTNDYILGLGGEQLTEMGMGGTTASDTTTTGLVWQHANIWSFGSGSGGGKLLGTYDKDGLHFYLDDPLGTRRAQTDAAGVLEQTCSSLPFGDGLACSEGDLLAPTENHFTGKERDVESGNDYFEARYYSSAMGRFMSPDPISLTADRLIYPQQLDLYSYVQNNPLRYVDPTGMKFLANGADTAATEETIRETAGDASDRLSFDKDTHEVKFDATGLDLSKNEGAKLINELVTSQHTYGFSDGPTMPTAGGPVNVVTEVNLPVFADQRASDPRKPMAGIDDQVGVYSNNPHIRIKSDTKLKEKVPYTLAFHELAEAYEKIDGGVGLYEKGHNATMPREDILRNQRRELKLHNPGSGGPANTHGYEGYEVLRR